MTLEWIWLVVGSMAFAGMCSKWWLARVDDFLGAVSPAAMVSAVTLAASWKYGWNVSWGPVREAIEGWLPQQGTEVHHATTMLILCLLMAASIAALAGSTHALMLAIKRSKRNQGEDLLEPGSAMKTREALPRKAQSSQMG